MYCMTNSLSPIAPFQGSDDELDLWWVSTKFEPNLL